MSISQYLWTTARELRAEVMPAVEDPSVRETLHNGLRILTWIANALEATAPDGTRAPGSDGTVADTDRLAGPPENAAAWRESGDALARAARSIDSAASASILSEQAEVIAWEKAALDQAIARVDAIEYAAAARIDREDHGISRSALQSYLRTRSAEPGLTITDFRPIHGGRSRQTALFRVDGAARLPANMVVQRGLPGGGGSAFVSEAVQFELMQVLHAAKLRIPAPILVETDEAALGAPFMITERAAGACAEPDFWLAPKDASLALDLAREMALLHRQPLGDIGPRLPQSRQRHDVEGWREELEELAAKWHELAHWPSVTMSAAIAWMRANVDCLEDRRSFVHNDLLFQNVMAENGRITAVLDWEQTSVGHPGEDLGYAYPQIRACGNWDAFLAAYRAAGGPDISQRQIDYFALRAGLRLMNLVMMGGRNVFENGVAEAVLPASAGAHFTQRLLHRIAGVLADVRARE